MMQWQAHEMRTLHFILIKKKYTKLFIEYEINSFQSYARFFFSENIATHHKITAINRSLCHGKAYLLLQSTYTPICMPRPLPCDAAPARALCIFISVVRCTCSTTKLLQFRIKAIIWAIIEMTVAGSIISSASSREPAAVTTMNKKKRPYHPVPPPHATKPTPNLCTGSCSQH